jgi:hypothetical protein
MSLCIALSCINSYTYLKYYLHMVLPTVQQFNRVDHIQQTTPHSYLIHHVPRGTSRHALARVTARRGAAAGDMRRRGIGCSGIPGPRARHGPDNSQPVGVTCCPAAHDPLTVLASFFPLREEAAPEREPAASRAGAASMAAAAAATRAVVSSTVAVMASH